MSRSSSTAYVIVHSLGGKTTLAHSYPGRFYDVDDARSEKVESLLKPLRRKGEWDAHNAIWHQQIRKWVRTLPLDATVLVHSLADARALSLARPGTLFRWHPLRDEFVRRLRDAATSDPQRALIAAINRIENMENPEYASLPWYSAIDERIAQPANSEYR